MRIDYIEKGQTRLLCVLRFNEGHVIGDKGLGDDKENGNFQKVSASSVALGVSDGSCIAFGSAAFSAESQLG